MLSYSSKVSAYEYYKTIERLTDNLGIGETPVSPLHIVSNVVLIQFLESL